MINSGISIPAIYIAGPYRAENAWLVEKNIRQAEEAALAISAMGMVLPMVPHTMFRYFNGTRTNEYWLAVTREMLRRCDAAYFCPGWKDSLGSVMEHERACLLAIPRCYSLEDVRLIIEDW